MTFFSIECLQWCNGALAPDLWNRWNKLLQAFEHRNQSKVFSHQMVSLNSWTDRALYPKMYECITCGTGWKLLSMFFFSFSSSGWCGGKGEVHVVVVTLITRRKLKNGPLPHWSLNQVSHNSARAWESWALLTAACVVYTCLVLLLWLCCLYMWLSLIIECLQLVKCLQI